MAGLRPIDAVITTTLPGGVRPATGFEPPILIDATSPSVGTTVRPRTTVGGAQGSPGAVTALFSGALPASAKAAELNETFRAESRQFVAFLRAPERVAGPLVAAATDIAGPRPIASLPREAQAVFASMLARPVGVR